MEKEKEIHSCVDCGTQNCKYKDRTYPDFCLTANLKDEDMEWALERYAEAYTTTLVTKDRVTGNNPAAALYTANSYYRKKFFQDGDKK